MAMVDIDAINENGSDAEAPEATVDAVALRAKRFDSVQADIDSLQRRFRQIELHRKQAGVSTGHLAEVKMLQLSRLKEISLTARDDLRLETDKQHSMIRHSLGLRIGRMQDEAERYHSKIAHETRKLNDIDKRIDKQRVLLIEQKKAALAALSSRDSVHYMERRLLVDEGKLDSALVKFSEALSQNKAMRESIDDLRRERTTFDSLVHRNELELHETKDELSVMMQKTLQMLEAKERTTKDLAVMKDTAFVELQKIEAEWHELARLLTEDSIQQEAQMMKDMQRAREKRNVKMSDAISGDAAKESKATARLACAENRVRETRHLISERTLHVREQEAAIAKVLQATGIDSIDKIVDAFVRAENSNFHLFSRLSEINAQIEAGEAEAIEMSAQRRALQMKAVSKEQVRRRKALEKIVTGEKTAESRIAEQSAVVKRANKTVALIIKRVTKFMKALSLDSGDPLAPDVKVNEANFEQYLVRMENHTNRLVNRYLQTHDMTDAERVKLVEVRKPAPVQIVAPDGTFGDDDDLDAPDDLYASGGRRAPSSASNAF
ncbi:ODAD1 central coiled coil region domain-containing protein [Plasmodiophora brassicae]|uniref:ODAD1 central coiled coil region domain-containing protein n=1 Tax=Plasmodiophora brassicae TaxID=37360 RepID=A0A0G4J720_PLABS|nr:hypothetical protein PBRA_003076 [Plasmodiophora brassicae]SPQ95556.1 unnamed protein product [Plasmodiophora brassicae]